MVLKRRLKRQGLMEGQVRCAHCGGVWSLIAFSISVSERESVWEMNTFRVFGLQSFLAMLITIMFLILFSADGSEVPPEPALCSSAQQQELIRGVENGRNDSNALVFYCSSREAFRSCCHVIWLDGCSFDSCTLSWKVFRPWELNLTESLQALNAST